MFCDVYSPSCELRPLFGLRRAVPRKPLRFTIYSSSPNADPVVKEEICTPAVDKGVPLAKIRIRDALALFNGPTVISTRNLVPIGDAG